MHKPRSQQLFEHALRFATPFTTTTGQPWAIVPDGGTRYHGWPVHSLRFREWLAYSFQHEFEIFPGTESMRAALALLAAHARYSEFPASYVFPRLGWRGNRLNPESVLIYLANPDKEVIEITPAGYRVVSSQSWRFLAGPSTIPLPRPEPLEQQPATNPNPPAPSHELRATNYEPRATNYEPRATNYEPRATNYEPRATNYEPRATNYEPRATIPAPLLELLQPLLGLGGPALHRVATWLFAALRPAGPYPALWLTGPPASGKSTIARILRTLIDPSSAPLLAPPTSERALFSLALHNRVLAFDDVSTLPRRTAASIARLATGAGLPLSTANILDDPTPLTIDRPVIVTARHPMPALTGAAIHVQLDAIPLENVRPLAAIARSVEQAAPSILGALCAAVAAALANIATAEIAPVSRMPDVQQWTLAAAPVLGLSESEINCALAAHPLVDRIHALLEQEHEWTGTPTELAAALAFHGKPQHLSEQLAAMPLAFFGLAMERSHNEDERRIRLTATSQVVVQKAAA